MELKPDMYVRTKDGDVFILDKIEDNHLIPRYVYIPYVIIEDDVKKTSHNIIDLIEVGDYVNGYKITTINDMSPVIYAEDKQGYLIEIITKENIKSIVTKEQFESMSYKVGD